MPDLKYNSADLFDRVYGASFLAVGTTWDGSVFFLVSPDM